MGFTYIEEEICISAAKRLKEDQVCMAWDCYCFAKLRKGAF